MVIKIENDILAEAQANNINVISTLESICRSQRKACKAHIVYGSYTTMDGLTKLKNIGSTEISVLKSIYNSLSTHGSLYTKIGFQCRLTTLNPTCMTVSGIIINPNEYPSFEFDREVHLLVENLLDAKMFEYVVDFYKRNHSDFLKIPISFFPWQGGGDTTHQNFKQAIDDKRYFCLSVLDGDRKHDGQDADYGDTYKKVSRLTNKYLPFNCMCYGTFYLREVENLIPFHIIKADNNYKNKQILVDNLLFDSSYFDFKEGLKHRSFADNKIATYWKLQLSQYPKLVNDIDIDIEFANLCKDSSEYKNACDKTVIIEGFGSRLLDYVLSNYSTELASIEIDNLSKNQLQEWSIIGKLIFEWSCTSLSLSKNVI